MSEPQTATDVQSLLAQLQGQLANQQHVQATPAHQLVAQPAQQPMQFTQQPSMVPQSGFGFAPPTINLQPIGISVPVTLMLPDGRECPINVHFPADALANPQQLGHSLITMFGQALKAYPPRQQSQYGNNGFGGGGGGGYNRGGYGRRY